MQTRLIATEDELVALKDDWNRLVRSDPATDVPFFSWEWFHRGWQHFAKPKGESLAVLAAQDAGRLAGLLPLVTGKRKSAGITYRTLEFCNAAATPRHTAYLAPDRDADAVCRLLLDEVYAMRSRWDMVELANVPETSPLHDFLERKTGKPRATIRWKGFVALGSELTGTVDDYIAGLSRNNRRYFRKKLRHFEEEPPPKTVRFYETPDDLPGGLERLFDVHRRSWKGDYANPHTPAFYRDVSADLALRGEFVVAIAFVGDDPAAAGCLLRNRDEYFYLICDYDPCFKDLSPGMMLYIYELEHMLRSGRRRFDFCGTAYEYKEKVCELRKEHSTFQLFSTRAGSRFLFFAKTLWLPLLRKLLRRPEPDDLIGTIPYC